MQNNTSNNLLTNSKTTSNWTDNIARTVNSNKSKSLLKDYNPYTPSFRHRIVLKGEATTDRESNISNKIKFNKRKLISGSTNKRGRNNKGRITCYTKGGGNKRNRRIIDHNRKIAKYGKSEVIAIENNPYSTASIALLKVITPEENVILHELNAPKLPEYLKKSNISKKQINKIYNKYITFNKKEFSNNNEKFFYILASNNLKVGDIIEGSLVEGNYTEGRSLKIKNIPSGSKIYNVELKPGSGGKIARAAGTSCILIKTIENSEGKLVSYIKLPSKKILEIDANCTATIGQVSRAEHSLRVLGKAGASRWLGIRPKTRGEAKNAVDHPHGGKSHGPGGIGNQPKNRWGKLAKWTKHKKKN